MSGKHPLLRVLACMDTMNMMDNPHVATVALSKAVDVGDLLMRKRRPVDAEVRMHDALDE